MGDAEIFGGWEEVRQVLGAEGGHGNLEGFGHHHGAFFICAAGVDVDHVEAGADGVGEVDGAGAGAVFEDDVLLADHALGLDAAGLADVGELGEAVGGAHLVEAEFQSGRFLVILKPV